jgi:hypothetical protein
MCCVEVEEVVGVQDLVQVLDVVVWKKKLVSVGEEEEL